MSLEGLPDDTPLHLNPLFRIRFEDGIKCELPLIDRQIELTRTALRAIAALPKSGLAKDIAGAVAEATALPAEAASRLVADLVEAGLLGREPWPDSLTDGIRLWADRGWLDALFLHLETRNLPYDDVSSGEEPASPPPSPEAPEVEIWKEAAGPVTLLPPPAGFPDEPLSQVLLRRRTSAAWRPTPVDLVHLSTILSHGNSELVQVRREVEGRLQDDPSLLMKSDFTALETAVFVQNVDGLEPGFYWYQPRDHSLVLQRAGNFEADLVEMCIGQPQLRRAGCVFVLCAVWKRYMSRYRHSRAYLNLLINVAALGHKYIIGATALGYSNWLTPAIRDEVGERILGSDMFEEAPLYTVAIG